MTERGVVRGVLVLAVALAVTLAVVSDDPAVSDACYLGVLVGAAVAAWVGVLRLPTGARFVPGLIAAGVSLTALGDVLWVALDRLGAATDVSVADVPWFGSYLALSAASWVVLTRNQRSGRADLAFVIDALTVVVVVVLVVWSSAVEVVVDDDRLPPSCSRSGSPTPSPTPCCWLS